MPTDKVPTLSPRFGSFGCEFKSVVETEAKSWAREPGKKKQVVMDVKQGIQAEDGSSPPAAAASQSAGQDLMLVDTPVQAWYTGVPHMTAREEGTHHQT